MWTVVWRMTHPVILSTICVNVTYFPSLHVFWRWEAEGGPFPKVPFARLAPSDDQGTGDLVTIYAYCHCNGMHIIRPTAFFFHNRDLKVDELWTYPNSTHVIWLSISLIAFFWRCWRIVCWELLFLRSDWRNVFWNRSACFIHILRFTLKALFSAFRDAFNKVGPSYIPKHCVATDITVPYLPRK